MQGSVLRVLHHLWILSSHEGMHSLYLGIDPCPHSLPFGWRDSAPPSPEYTDKERGDHLIPIPLSSEKSSRSPIYQHRKLRIYKFYSDTPFSPAHQTQNWIWSKAFSVSSLHTWFNETHILDGVMLDKMLRWDRHLSFRSRGNGLERL